ncbi:MAG: TPM domain-containing protein [Nitrospira sp.]|nr:TPM domain-containing protein [Nitrospira sp.]
MAEAILGEGVPVETGEQLELTAEERERIRLAVHAAEQHTNAEIVPMIVSRSGLYRDAQHRLGLLLSFVVLTLMLTTELFWLPWGWHGSNAAWLVLAAVSAYGVGAWLGTMVPCIRFLTPTDRLHHKVRLRAERAFRQHAVSQTREHTGVLIMVSLLEHQIYVLADQSIAQRVPSERWSSVVEAAGSRLTRGDLVGGLCQGIQVCGTLLAEVSPSRSGDNPDELSNELVIES